MVALPVVLSCVFLLLFCFDAFACLNRFLYLCFCIMGIWIFGEVNNGTARWEPDPSNGRGTWTILVSCIITLTLCVYTSLHLNIPAHKSTRGVIFGMKAKYVTFGLLAPELIVFNAWRQRTIASAFVGRLRKERGGKQPKPWYQRLVHGLKSLPRRAFRGIVSLPQRLTSKQKKNGDQVRTGLCIISIQGSFLTSVSRLERAPHQRS